MNFQKYVMGNPNTRRAIDDIASGAEAGINALFGNVQAQNPSSAQLKQWQTWANNQVQEAHGIIKKQQSDFTVLLDNKDKIIATRDECLSGKDSYIKRLENQSDVQVEEISSLKSDAVKRDTTVDELTTQNSALLASLSKANYERLYADAVVMAQAAVVNLYKIALSKGVSFEEVQKHEANVFELAFRKHLENEDVDSVVIDEMVSRNNASK